MRNLPVQLQPVQYVLARPEGDGARAPVLARTNAARPRPPSALLALGAFWALRHGRSGSFTVDPNNWKQETETSPRLLTFNTRAGEGEGGNHEQLAIQIDRCSVLLLNYLLAPGLYIYRFVGPHTYYYYIHYYSVYS